MEAGDKSRIPFKSGWDREEVGWDGVGSAPPSPSQQLWLYMKRRTGLWDTGGAV